MFQKNSCSEFGKSGTYDGATERGKQDSSASKAPGINHTAEKQNPEKTDTIHPEVPIAEEAADKRFEIKDHVLVGYHEENGEHTMVVPEGVSAIGEIYFYKSCGSGMFEADDIEFYGWESYNLWCTGDIWFVELPNSVKRIEARAFYRSEVKRIAVPDSVRYIGAEAFSECFDLQSISISGRITSIEPGTFKGCSHLESITIPDSVTAIGPNAFKGCSRLKSIIIPDSVKSIGKGAFDGCISLDIDTSDARFADYVINDDTYIRSISERGGSEIGNDFMIELAARGYGWEAMISWADYVVDADLNRFYCSYDVGNYNSRSLFWSKSEGSAAERLNPDEEYTFLSVNGYSDILGPVSISWYNQTNKLVIRTKYGFNIAAMRRYAESLVRRNFGTKDAMKLAKHKS